MLVRSLLRTTCQSVRSVACCQWKRHSAAFSSATLGQPRHDGRIVLKETDDLVFEVLQDRHAAQTTESFADVWVEDNVIMRALGVTRDDFLPIARKRVQSAISNQLGLVACAQRSPSSSDNAASEPHVVGFFINQDMATASWDTTGVNPKFLPQFKFLSELQAQYTQYRGGSYPKGEVHHGICGGMVKEYAGKHIMTDLFKLTHVWAQHLGFKRMVVETMVIASETITSKAGWTKIATKEFASFEFEGRKPFEAVPQVSRTPHAVLFEYILPLEPLPIP